MPKAPFGAALLALGMSVSPLAQSQAPRPADLRIIVISGEDAVNIVQLGTAVAPVVEVRDRNNQPVAGAVVTFTLQGGSHATFAGASAVSATTNAIGQAAVTSLTPTGVGAVQINVAAAFQGQTATAAITQTNFATAAQAAASSGASSGASGAAAGGSGGGLGAGTITAIAGEVTACAAGGLYYYREAQKGDPPMMEGLTIFPASGLTAITPIDVTPSSMTWHDEGEAATLTIDFGDGTTISLPMNNGGDIGFGRNGHIYQSAGTYTVRVTLTDAWDRAASQQGSVTIKSLTGRWNVGTTAAFFTLTQQGAALSGSYTSTSAQSCGGLTGTTQPMAIFNNLSGNVTVAVTPTCNDFSSFTGSTTFATPDQMVGTLTSRNGTSNVNLNRQ